MRRVATVLSRHPSSADSVCRILPTVPSPNCQPYSQGLGSGCPRKQTLPPEALDTPIDQDVASEARRALINTMVTGLVGWPVHQVLVHQLVGPPYLANIHPAGDVALYAYIYSLVCDCVCARCRDASWTVRVRTIPGSIARASRGRRPCIASSRSTATSSSVSTPTASSTSTGFGAR